MDSGMKTHDNHPARIALMVAGMARSGTSAMAGALGLCGGALPRDLLKPSIHNAKGFFESVELVGLYDEILAAQNSSNVDWDAFPLEWQLSPLARPYMDRAIALFKKTYPADAPLVIMKDPRFCRLFPFTERWLQEMGIDIRVVLPFRHPIEVAHSQADSFGMTPAQSYLNWLRYVLDGEHFTRHRKRVFIHFADFLADSKKNIMKIQEALEIQFPLEERDYEKKVMEFLDPALKKYTAQPKDIKDLAFAWVGETYEALFTLSEHPYNEKAMATLDRIKGDLDRACLLFSPVLDSHITAKKTQEMLVRELKAMRNSTSWRITRPLRALSLWLRYVR